MSGVGEVGAAFGLLQFGFSIATVLTTYIADVKDAKDDVRNLASELDSTLRHLDELNRLAEANKSKKGWNANGEGLVLNCNSASSKAIEKLVHLLSKSGNDINISPQKEFDRDDVDLTIFHKASWPWYKDQVNIVKRELQYIKIDILLARDVYKASVGTIAEREGAQKRLAGLSRGQVVTLKHLQRARRKGEDHMRPIEKPKIIQEPGTKLTWRSPIEEIRQPHDPVEKTLDMAERNVSDDDSESTSSSTANALFDELKADIENEILERRIQADVEARVAREEKAQVETSAVAEYKRSLLDALAKSKQDATELTAKLEDFFDGVPKSRINDFVQKQMDSQERSEDVKELAFRLSQVMQAESPFDPPQSNGARMQSKPFSSKSSIWSSRSRTSKHLPSALLRQEGYPECARILTLMLKFEGRESVVDPIHVSMDWLIKQMKKEETLSTKNGLVSSTLETWSNLPTPSRASVAAWLRVNTSELSAWSLVFARDHIVQSSTRQRLLQRLLGVRPMADQTSSVLLVYRHSRISDDVKPTAPTRNHRQLSRRRTSFDRGDAARSIITEFTPPESPRIGGGPHRYTGQAPPPGTMPWTTPYTTAAYGIAGANRQSEAYDAPGYYYQNVWPGSFRQDRQDNIHNQYYPSPEHNQPFIAGMTDVLPQTYMNPVSNHVPHLPVHYQPPFYSQPDTPAQYQPPIHSQLDTSAQYQPPVHPQSGLPRFSLNHQDVPGGPDPWPSSRVYPRGAVPVPPLQTSYGMSHARYHMAPDAPHERHTGLDHLLDGLLGEAQHGSRAKTAREYSRRSRAARDGKEQQTGMKKSSNTASRKVDRENHREEASKQVQQNAKSSASNRNKKDMRKSGGESINLDELFDGNLFDGLPAPRAARESGTANTIVNPSARERRASVSSETSAILAAELLSRYGINPDINDELPRPAVDMDKTVAESSSDDAV